MAVDPKTYIYQNASKHGLDPAAVMAYAMEEGGLKWGAVGDKGTSFGPFQAHIGGANPFSDPAKAAAWANSPQGLDQMMGMMSRTSAKGLTGKAAARAIELEFGRGADPQNTVLRAYGFLPQAQQTVQEMSRNAALNQQMSGPDMGTPAEQGLRAIGQGTTMSKYMDNSPEFKNLLRVNASINAAQPSQAESSLLGRLGGMTGEIAQRMSKVSYGSPYSPPEQTRIVGQLFPGVSLGVDHSEPMSPGAVPIVNEARQWLGTKYVFGAGNARGPTSGGFDCSGFVKYLYSKDYGVDLPHNAAAQFQTGKPVKQADLMPGDVVFFVTDGTKKAPGHEGIYVGNGQFIHAPHTGDVVKVSSLSDAYYAKNFIAGRRYVSGNK